MTTALEGVSGQQHAPAALDPRERPGTHFIGRCPEGSRKLRFPDFMTKAQDGGKVVSLTLRPLFYPQEIILVLIYVKG